MKVLMIGHACSPNHGSEPGIAWNWAWQMSNYHEVWLIAHPRYRDKADAYLRDNPNPRLHIFWVELDARWDPWNPEHGSRGLRLHYVIWQRKAFREARRLHALHRFDVAHHVSWMTISSPPRAWRLGIPLVWGPIGGGQVTPGAFSRYFKGSRLTQTLRTARVRLMPYLPSLRAAARHANLMLATNPETKSLLEKAGARNVRLAVDAGIPASSVADTCPERPARDGLTVLWAGRFEPRKCLPLSLEAIAGTGDRPIRLLVAGDGPMRGEWEARSRELNLEDKVRFLGRLAWTDMWQAFMDADVFLFTSLNDSFGTVVVEAMSQGLPVVTLDHQGVGCFVPPDAGIKVPVTSPEKTVTALARALERLADDRTRRIEMGHVAWSYARTVTWERKAEQMDRWYEELASGVPAARPRDEAGFEPTGERALVRS